MLPINIISMQNILFQPMIFSNIKTDNDKEVYIIDQQTEMNRYLLKSFYNVCLYSKDNSDHPIFREFSEKSLKLGYMKFNEFKKVTLWKEWLKGAILMVTFPNTDAGVLEVSQSYELEVSWFPNSLICYFILNEAYWEKISKIILPWKNGQIIKFAIKTTNNKNMPLLSLRCINEHSIEMHRPLIQTDESDLLKDIITNDMKFYYDCYMDHLFILFQILQQNKQPDELQISNNVSDIITLNLCNEKVPLFIFGFEKVPTLVFFNEFGLKLVVHRNTHIYCGEQPLSDSKNLSSSIRLEFILSDKILFNDLKMQITLYEQNKKSCDNLPNLVVRTTYLNLDLSSKTTISCEKQLVDMLIKIEKGKLGGYHFTLNFSKASNTSIFCVKDILLKSIKNIIIKVFGKTMGTVEQMEISPSNIKKKYFFFKRQFTISQDTSEESNIANNILYDILEKRNGFFSIQVETVDGTLFEYKVNLRPKYMYVLSSNKLKVHKGTLKTDDNDIYI